MQNDSFNLLDLSAVINKRKSFIMWFVATACIITALLLVFVLPTYYKSTAIIVAGNPLLADKGRMFNENVEGLYSDFGSEEDLNRLYGIAQLDTTYKLLVDKFNLIQYYDISKSNVALNRQKAVDELKKAIQITKSEFYQLKISASTKDRKLSAALANEMVTIVEAMMQQRLKQNYEKSIAKLSESSKQIEQEYQSLSDSIQPGNQLVQVKLQALLQQLQLNEKLAGQLKVAATTNSPAVIVQEHANPSVKADTPRKLIVMLAAFVSSLVFSVVVVLILERRK